MYFDIPPTPGQIEYAQGLIDQLANRGNSLGLMELKLDLDQNSQECYARGFRQSGLKAHELGRIAAQVARDIDPIN